MFALKLPSVLLRNKAGRQVLLGVLAKGFYQEQLGYLMRPDVLPLDDLGLLKAVALHYNSGQALPRAEVQRIAQGWRPWRTVATWMLWRSLDPIAVSY